MNSRNVNPLLVAAALVVSLAVTSAVAVAKESGGVKPVQDIENNTQTATNAELRAAKPLQPYLSGASVNEPDGCIDQEGNPIFKLTETPDLGTTEGNGLSISPGNYEMTNLLPGVDYRACAVFRNYSDTPATIEVDDVDLRASEQPDAGVALIDQTSGVGTWVLPATRSFVAKKGIVYTIPYVLRVPKILPAGTIVGGIRLVRQAIDEPVQAAVTQRIYISSPGGTRGLIRVENLSSNRLITGKPGKAALNVRYTLRNSSDYLSSIEGTLELKGWGRKVAAKKLAPTTLLPDGSERVLVRQDELPWIGVYQPVLKLKTTEGVVERKLPRIWVLPPLPYTIAVILAILGPIGFLIFRWWRNRQAWRQYLDEFEEEEGAGEDAEDWDPAHQ